MKVGNKDYRKYNKTCPCPACGEVGTTDKYCIKNQYSLSEDIADWPENWIKRICNNCGCWWFELPFNYKNDSAK